jgi:hypothetical protein
VLQSFLNVSAFFFRASCTEIAIQLFQDQHAIFCE